MFNTKLVRFIANIIYKVVSIDALALLRNNESNQTPEIKNNDSFFVVFNKIQ